MSPIIRVKETRVFRGVSSFLKKASASPILSHIMKVGASLFIMKGDASLISDIERHVLEWQVSVSYPLYKTRS
jgi:hypothetical protein